MRLDQALTEQYSIGLQESLPAIKRECSDYLKEMARTGEALIRGSDRSTSVFSRKYPRNRPARDTSRNLQVMFELIMDRMGYGEYSDIRNSSAFAYTTQEPSNMRAVESYGGIYLMIPQNGSVYFAFDGVGDLTIELGNIIESTLIEVAHDIDLDVPPDVLELFERMDELGIIAREFRESLDVVKNPDDYSLEEFEQATTNLSYVIRNTLVRDIRSKRGPVLPDSILEMILDLTGDIEERIAGNVIISNRFSDVLQQAGLENEILVTGDRGYYMINAENIWEEFGVTHGQDLDDPQVVRKIAEQILAG